MALVERLMHWGGRLGDTEPPAFEPRARHIAVHSFLAVNIEVLLDNRTVTQVKGFLDMTPEDEVDYDALIALVNAEQKADAKHRLMHHFDSVLVLAEKRNPGYSTPADVRSELGI